jgi:hypothetical protein
MKSRHDRVRVSVLAAVVLVFGVAGWATAQQVNSFNALKDSSVKGSGTAGTIPLWTGSNTIGDSSITQSGNDQTINGGLNVTGNLALPNATAPNAGVISIGGVPVLYTLPPFFLSPPVAPCGRNTFVGPSAGNFTTTGFSNTATGDEALDSITTGFQNTATGNHALFANTTGRENVATGDNALVSNTTGDGNTATGFQTLASNTTGNLNTATGENAHIFNTTGSDNVATGAMALHSNFNGRFNTAIGFGAGGSVTSGENNINIGSNVSGVGSESNTVRIGNVNNNRTFIAREQTDSLCVEIGAQHRGHQ